MEQAEVARVFLLGDPAYYSRLALNLTSPFCRHILCQRNGAMPGNPLASRMTSHPPKERFPFRHPGVIAPYGPLSLS